MKVEFLKEICKSKTPPPPTIPRKSLLGTRTIDTCLDNKIEKGGSRLDSRNIE